MKGNHQSLLESWRQRAAKLRQWGAPEVGRIWELAAGELEDDERERALEALPLAEAARESGYSVAHLGRMLAEGRLKNVGRKGAPRIQRDDLPRKPHRRTARGDPDLVGEVFAERGLHLDP